MIHYLITLIFKYVEIIDEKVIWCSYWVFLGILSSIGLGSGLHTFVLYLGPHIAKVTLAAYECGTLDFQKPPYPHEIKCPVESPSISNVDIFSIMSKVRLEAFMWGMGTAIGELPPYFMARTARLSGENINLNEKSTTGKKKKSHDNESKWKEKIEAFVTKAGFFGILACASIPNPLFDLAGITCGYSLIPFWTFFGATLIGKAVIKMMIQKLFVIVAFSEEHFEAFLKFFKNVPVLGEKVGFYLEEFLQNQKSSLHVTPGSKVLKASGSVLSSVLEWFVISMVLYFLLTIVNSMAQQNVNRSQESSSQKKGQRKKAQ